MTSVAWSDPQQMGGTHVSGRADLESAERAGRSMIEVNGRAERMDVEYAVGVLMQSPPARVTA